MPMTDVELFIREDLLAWMDQKVKERLFSTRSHAVECSLETMKASLDNHKREGVHEGGIG